MYVKIYVVLLFVCTVSSESILTDKKDIITQRRHVEQGSSYFV